MELYGAMHGGTVESVHHPSDTMGLEYIIALHTTSHLIPDQLLYGFVEVYSHMSVGFAALHCCSTPDDVPFLAP